MPARMPKHLPGHQNDRPHILMHAPALPAHMSKCVPKLGTKMAKGTKIIKHLLGRIHLPLSKTLTEP